MTESWSELGRGRLSIYKRSQNDSIRIMASGDDSIWHQKHDPHITLAVIAVVKIIHNRDPNPDTPVSCHTNDPSTASETTPVYWQALIKNSRVFSGRLSNGFSASRGIVFHQYNRDFKIHQKLIYKTLRGYVYQPSIAWTGTWVAVRTLILSNCQESMATIPQVQLNQETCRLDGYTATKIVQLSRAVKFKS